MQTMFNRALFFEFVLCKNIGLDFGSVERDIVEFTVEVRFELELLTSNQLACNTEMVCNEEIVCCNKGSLEFSTCSFVTTSSYKRLPINTGCRIEQKITGIIRICYWRYVKFIQIDPYIITISVILNPIWFIFRLYRYSI